MMPARDPKQCFLKYLGRVWETLGRHLGDIWEARGERRATGDLGEKNLFFIPTIYINSFNKNIRDICLGRNNLEKTLRKKL